MSAREFQNRRSRKPFSVASRTKPKPEGTCNEDICSHFIRSYRRSKFYDQIQNSAFKTRKEVTLLSISKMEKAELSSDRKAGPREITHRSAASVPSRSPLV